MHVLLQLAELLQASMAAATLCVRREAGLHQSFNTEHRIHAKKDYAVGPCMNLGREHSRLQRASSGARLQHASSGGFLLFRNIPALSCRCDDTP
jgi:hypothetical protein